MCAATRQIAGRAVYSLRLCMLRLQLLGGFRAHADNVDVSSLAKQPRRAALLTLLAIERDVTRERVIGMLWPDAPPGRGRHSLNQSIYYLRRLIASDWVELHGDRCIIAPWVTTDVGELERAAEAGAFEDVLRLYQGPLLAGTSLAATAEFDIWADGRRAATDRLHRRARRRRIEQLIADGRAADALRVAEEWSRLDPLEDEAHHRLMQLLAASGQRAAALRQYGTYSRLLDEHGLKPLEETVELVEHLQHGELGTSLGAAPLTHVPSSPAVETVPTADGRGSANAPEPPFRPFGPTPRLRRTPVLLRSRAGLGALLAIVFAVNWIETTIETWLAPRLPAIAALRLELARAAHWLEGYISFEYHDLVNPVAVVGYTASYFFIFPLLLAGVGLALARRSSIRPFRVFSVAVAVNYAISLPFFLLFPVPERWWYPESGAMLLSDLVSTHLIEVFRPISGLDNSFPSFHVSLTVLTMIAAFLFGVRHRWTVLFLGGNVVLATIVLGIHWAGDLVAGLGAGVLSVVLAVRIDERLPDTGARAPAATPRQTPAAVPARRELEPR
jgi:DNA-binding SARP family transcriptional activator/membrane-associated phospholipid phosphatase